MNFLVSDGFQEIGFDARRPVKYDRAGRQEMSFCSLLHALYATDVTFQQCNYPSGSTQKKHLLQQKEQTVRTQGESARASKWAGGSVFRKVSWVYI